MHMFRLTGAAMIMVPPPPPQKYTAEEFLAALDELPEGGQWTELVAGEIRRLSPPTMEHGNVVLNLSKALADHLQKPNTPTYACFELGLIIARNPDTVRYPACSVYTTAPKFGESDKLISENRPSLVIDIASSRDRRKNLEARLQAFHDWGVLSTWVIDPEGRFVFIAVKGRAVQRFGEHQTLVGGDALEGFRMQVADLFREPSWWLGKPKP
jgi:Uma2 family endonuclease